MERSNACNLFENLNNYNTEKQETSHNILGIKAQLSHEKRQ